MTSLAVTDATVVTMDPTRAVHTGATIRVDDGAITSIGGPDGAPADRVIDAAGGIVIPGLVNAHTHLAMTMFRGLADDIDLDGFLARLLPAEGAVLSPETVAAGTTLAVAESLRAGITTALDMYFFPEAAAAVAAAAGFRLLAGPVFVEFAGPDRRRFVDRLAWAGDLLRAASPDARWVCPHSTYLLDEPQLVAVAELAAATEARIHLHACETTAELSQVRSRHGRTPIEVLHDTGLLGPGTVLAHAVHLTEDDLALVTASGAAVAHCPASNQKLASGLARVPELVAAGVPVALGTDGPASANDLDLFVAMRLAGYPQAVRLGAGVLPASTLLRMATIDGAQALGIADRVGSIEVGKQADLVVLDASSPALAPSYDPVSTVVYAASRGDVRWVLAGGRVVVDDRRLTTIDADEAIGAVRALQPTIAAAVA